MRFSAVFMLCLALAAQSHASVSKQDARAAHDAFKRGLKLEKQKHDDEAFASFQEAAQLDPEERQYIAARELMRQKLVSDHLQKGNAAMLSAGGPGQKTAADRRVEAMAEFQAAVDLDPKNDYALGRLHELASESGPQAEFGEAPLSPTLKQVAEQAYEVRLRPSPKLRDIHFRGDSRAMMTQLAELYGLTPVFDENFTPLAVSLELRQASFEQAIAQAAPQAKAMWTPLSEKEIFFANDTQDNRQQYEHTILRTFYVSDIDGGAKAGGSSSEALNELVALLRSIYNIHNVVADPAQSTITIRAPRHTLDAAADFISSMNMARPQVVLDIRAYEINRTFLDNLGVSLPTQFQMISVSNALLNSIANQPDIQAQIQKIIQNGGLTPQNQDAINALLAQLASQQNSQIAQLLKQPFVLFGGGTSRYAVVIPPVTINFNFNQSSVVSLEHVTLHASHGQPTTMHIGERFPIQNAINSPIVSNPLLALPGSQVSTFPSFSYEDLGIMVKLTPLIHMHMVPNRDAGPGPHPPEREEAEVTLKDVDLSIRSLSGASFNNVPVISNKEYTGTVRVKDGESTLLVGSISHQQLRSLSGLPFFSRLFGPLTSNSNKNNADDEIMVIVTPHIVRAPDQLENPEQWLPPGSP
jgi:Flp pilus assembly secretin CpaC